MGKWRARYRDESGQERTRHFNRGADAQFWLDQIIASVITGTYADPRAGQITFAAFYGEWSARQVWVPGTVYAMAFTAQTVPFSDKPMRLIRRSDVEVWIKSMDARGLAPGPIKTRYVNVRSVFRAAVKDRIISKTPPTSPTPPPASSRRSYDHPSARRRRPADDRRDTQVRTFIALCAFAGLRLSEAACVQLGDVDFIRQQLKVIRQVQRALDASTEIRAPKYGSERIVRLADGVIDLVA
jgi:integrase